MTMRTRLKLKRRGDVMLHQMQGSWNLGKLLAMFREEPGPWASRNFVQSKSTGWPFPMIPG